MVSLELTIPHCSGKTFLSILLNFLTLTSYYSQSGLNKHCLYPCMNTSSPSSSPFECVVFLQTWDIFLTVCTDQCFGWVHRSCSSEFWSSFLGHCSLLFLPESPKCLGLPRLSAPPQLRESSGPCMFLLPVLWPEHSVKGFSLGRCVSGVTVLYCLMSSFLNIIHSSILCGLVLVVSSGKVNQSLLTTPWAEIQAQCQ